MEKRQLEKRQQACEFLTLSQAAAFLSRSPKWLRTKLGNIQHYRPDNGHIIFKREDLERYMEAHRIDPIPDVDSTSSE